ncbi:MotA/TolQ/ExbB proton channel family protein [Enterovibrio norvegicus]|uniref:MotA/TolQ/ExbB proton channel family protein n=1 Tax=Enterovibrio norvegicus TaxID=188144 RepID=UPI000C81C5F0|nr:MotA/TolQ/ExbB proton channel family protein [Enterovibrio norvegicus]
MSRMKRTLIAALTVSTLLSSLPALADLASDTRVAQQQSNAHNVAREAGFEETEQSLKAQLATLDAQHAALEIETQTLSDTFSDNEQYLAELDESLRLETGTLGELFGVLRQSSRELQNERVDAPAAIGQPDYNAALDLILDAKTLPSLSALNTVWHGMQEELENGRVIAPMTLNVRDAEGVVTERNVTRLGNIGLVDQHGYLGWNSAKRQANLLPVQPKHGLTSNALAQAQAGDSVILDPTRTELLQQLAFTPTLSERFEQGGLVGKIIAVLLFVGLAISAVRGASLFRARVAIRKQMKHPETAGDNPLGRILSVYQQAPNRSLDALELHLLEAIVDEQQGFEKGLSMLKLLAALAPMLGLLGTVTGMIETFQVITQFGNGDPTVMAGGISMALITTVLGLVAAMPLLLAHNVLSTQAETLRGTLEKVGISLIAQQSDLADNTVTKAIA